MINTKYNACIFQANHLPQMLLEALTVIATILLILPNLLVLYKIATRPIIQVLANITLKRGAFYVIAEY